MAEFSVIIEIEREKDPHYNGIETWSLNDTFRFVCAGEMCIGFSLLNRLLHTRITTNSWTVHNEICSLIAFDCIRSDDQSIHFSMIGVFNDAVGQICETLEKSIVLFEHSFPRFLSFFSSDIFLSLW